MKNKIYCFINSTNKYLEDLSYLGFKLNIKFYIFIYKKSIEKNNKNYSNVEFITVNKLKDINNYINKKSIIIWFWRWFWWIPFEHISYFLNWKVKKILCIADWISINNNNFNIKIDDSNQNKINILKEYFKFYWLKKTLYIIINTLIWNKVKYYYIFKNYWILELTRIYNNKTIIEQ